MDFVYIRDGHNHDNPIIKECTGWKCGNQRSSGNKIQIHFLSDHVTTDLGFSARVTAVETDPCYCSKELKIDLVNLRESFTIESPGYPGPYCKSLNCQWTFVAPESYGLHITFKTFDLEPGSDHLYIFDGGLDSDTLLDKCTGKNCPDRITPGNQLRVTFSTDPLQSSNDGFQGIVTVVQNFCDIKDIEQLEYLEEVTVSEARADGYIPVGANGMLVCTENAKVQGTSDKTTDAFTCKSPQWTDVQICVLTCKVEFENFVQKNGLMPFCKTEPGNEPKSLMESGDQITLGHYDLLSQLPVVGEDLVYSCAHNEWTDQFNNSYNSITCPNFDRGPKILLIGGMDGIDYNVGDQMELYYPTNPKQNRILGTQTAQSRLRAVSGVISDGTVVTHGGINQYESERFYPKQQKVERYGPEVYSLRESRDCASSAVLDSTMYICGGYDRSISGEIETIGLKSCEKYLGYGDEFGTVYIASMTIGRFGHFMVAYNGQLVAIGGYYGGNEVEAYTPTDDSWSEFPKLNQAAPNLGAAAVVDHSLLFCGGKEGPDSPAKSTCEQYDPENKIWFYVARMNRARAEFAMVTIANQIFAIGGSDGTDWDNTIYMNTVEMFNGRNWTILDTKLKNSRSRLTAVLIP